MSDVDLVPLRVHIDYKARDIYTEKLCEHLIASHQTGRICSKTEDVRPLICTGVTCKLSICTEAVAEVQIDSLQVTSVQISGGTSEVFEQIHNLINISCISNSFCIRLKTMCTRLKVTCTRLENRIHMTC